MHRCFVNHFIGDNQSVVIDGEEAKHIGKVLRSRVGDQLEVCDGSKMVYLCTITKVSNGSVEATVDSAKEDTREPQSEITVFQGLSKGTKMDLVIQKAVELGAHAVVPVQMEFSVVKMIQERGKQERWQRIAMEAAKQCKRSVIPKVLPAVDFSTALNMMSEMDQAFAAYENETETPLKAVLNTKFRSCGFLIGPEGGFSIPEVEQARNAGIPTVSLGKRILRTETASIALLSIVMFYLGEMG